MKKLCDSCRLYIPEYQFCTKLYIKTGRNLVDYCRDYIPEEKRARHKLAP